MSELLNMFVSKDSAKELKELGFDEICLGYWNKIEYQEEWELDARINPDSVDYIEAPTWEQAFKFLKTKFKMHGQTPIANSEEIKDKKGIFYNIEIITLQNTFAQEIYKFICFSDVYEMAREYCLKLIILLCKNTN